MGYSRENRHAAEEKLAARRQAAVKKAQENRENLYAACPEMRKLDTALSGTAAEICRIALGRSANVREEIEALKRENLQRQKKRAQMLAEIGLPADFTDIRYTCGVCGDTGYTDKGMCKCLKQLLIEEGFRSSGLGHLIEKQSFENFSLDYYEGQAKELASHALETARRFAEDFDKTHANLLFIGGTGLGKTHLSTAVARRAIERGFDVVYDGVQNILSDFEHDRFRSGYEEGESRSEKYFSCDLLILDDLGTEISNQFTLSVLYQLLNTRLCKGQSIIINTNLGQKNLLERYDERITSRLLGEFFPCLFRGTDIRRQK